MSEYIVRDCKARVIKEYDVIVAGGGMAGCAAAVAAARNGASVLLVEKLITLGGLATNGLVSFWEPSLSAKRSGKKLMGGLCEEMCHLAIKYGFNTLSPDWKYGQTEGPPGSVYSTAFSAASCMCALDELLIGAGAEILFDSVCCDVDFENGVCKGVFVENKEGCTYYGCKMLVDVTGDADLFKRCGAPCVEDINWLSYWANIVNLERAKKCVEKGDVEGIYYTRSFGAFMDGRNNPPGARQYTIETGEEVTSFVLDARGLFRDYLKTMDIKREMPINIPSQAQYRTTRRIEGVYVMGMDDRNKHHDDTIGCASVENIPTADGVLFQIEIPYRALIVSGFKNMITAGRSISSTGTVRELTRLIGCCAVTGEAAGTACAIACEQDCSIDEVPVPELQRRMVEAKNILRFTDDLTDAKSEIEDLPESGFAH